MLLEKKDNLCNLANQLEALSTIQNEYSSLISFVNDIRETLTSSYDSKTNNYNQEGIEKVLKIIDSQIDGFHRTSAEVIDNNYNLNLISKRISDELQKGIMKII